MTPVFISVVGTQASGTLQPLMWLHSSAGPVRIYLFYTSFTKDVAERVAEFIRQGGYGDVELQWIDDETDTEQSAPAVIERIVKQAREDGAPVYINLTGGTNYLVAAIILKIEHYKPFYIHATDDRIVITDAEREAYDQRRLPPALKPEELLLRQGVDFETEAPNPEEHESRPFTRIMKEEKIREPEGALKNVRINDYVFDYVWNSGNNKLCFFKDWRMRCASAGDRRERDRDFAQWSKDRSRCGQLFDKKVYALVSDELTQQRLRENSNCRITPILYDAPNPKITGAVSAAAEELNNIFCKKPPRIREQGLKVPAPAAATPLRDNTLVVCVGTKLLSTLLAIWSHKPKHVVLAYSRNNRDIEGYIKNLLPAAKELGVESVEAVNFSLEGIHADVALPEPGPDNPRVLTNITPGTKGHAAMLARWAARHGFEAWSIDRSRNRCQPLNASCPPVPICGSDPAAMLKLSGIELHSEGKSAAELEQDADWLNAMLEFMRKADAAGIDFGRFFKEKHLKVGNNQLQVRNKSYLLRLDGKEYRIRNEKDSSLLEKLCAWSLITAGASHVRVNLEYAWNEANRSLLAQRHGGAWSQMELDVLGFFDGDVVLISCKAYDLFNHDDAEGCVSYEEAVQNAATSAGAVDQFALALVAHAGVAGEPAGGKARLVGWREICHPEKLAGIIRELSVSKSTTRKG